VQLTSAQLDEKLQGAATPSLLAEMYALLRIEPVVGFQSSGVSAGSDDLARIVARQGLTPRTQRLRQAPVQARSRTVSINATAPAWDTVLVAVVSIWTRGYNPIFFTRKVLLVGT